MANWVNEELYTYDMYGNQTGVEVYEINEEITSSEKAGDVRYSYDESNQMVQYETKGVEETEWTQAARNVYNGEGMRIRQYENGNDWARQYFYIGGALAISTDGSNENFVKSENILDPSGTILAARREAKDGEQIEGSAYWIYHYDAQGSATNLVGVKDGALYRAEENVYDAFGNEETGMKETVSSVQNDIKFTGATLDNSGTYYLGSRHYDPNTGRFLQQDTFKGDVYSPWTQNLYTYTSNNPVNYIDPTGHYYEQVLGGIGEALDWMFGVVGAKTNFRENMSTKGKELDEKYDTHETPEEMVELAQKQRKIRKSKKSGVFGAGYNEHKANLMMELMITLAADEEGRNIEHGAFVYQREDGLYYISNVLEDKMLNVSEEAFLKEAKNLGLLEGGGTVELSFGHTHSLSDGKVADHPYWSYYPKEEADDAIAFYYGSDTDAKTVYEGSMGQGRMKIKNYVIYSPHKIGDGWDVERWPKVPTWK